MSTDSQITFAAKALLLQQEATQAIDHIVLGRGPIDLSPRIRVVADDVAWSLVRLEPGDEPDDPVFFQCEMEDDEITLSAGDLYLEHLCEVADYVVKAAGNVTGT